MNENLSVRLVRIGWDDDLVVETGEIPEPSGEQVRIEVEACGVCYRDLVDRSGRFPFIRLPISPGHEVVGHVTAVGPRVTDWAVGDRVASMHRDFCGTCPECEAGQTCLCANALALLGLLVDGGYQRHMVAPQRCFYRMPEDVPAAEAAVLHCTFGTAYRGLKVFGDVKPGQHVLVTGANGGVGTAAIQIAKRLGAQVTAVVRDASHQAPLEVLGANRVIVDTEGRFHKKVGAKKADVVAECVGPPTFNASLRALRLGGRLIVIGNVVQEKAALNLGYVITRGLQVIGTGGATRANMAELLALHVDQPFEVQIHEQLGLDQADRAQRSVRAGGLHGRIVLVPTSANSGVPA